jgi:hypothetical protein
MHLNPRISEWGISVICLYINFYIGFPKILSTATNERQSEILLEVYIIKCDWFLGSWWESALNSQLNEGPVSEKDDHLGARF